MCHAQSLTCPRVRGGEHPLIAQARRVGCLGTSDAVAAAELVADAAEPPRHRAALPAAIRTCTERALQQSLVQVAARCSDTAQLDRLSRDVPLLEETLTRELLANPACDLDLRMSLLVDWVRLLDPERALAMLAEDRRTGPGSSSWRLAQLLRLYGTETHGQSAARVLLGAWEHLGERAGATADALVGDQHGRGTDFLKMAAVVGACP